MQKNRVRRNGRDVFGASLISPPSRQSGVVEFFQQFIKKGLTPRREPLSHIRNYKLRLQIRGFPAPPTHHPCADNANMAKILNQRKRFSQPIPLFLPALGFQFSDDFAVFVFIELKAGKQGCANQIGDKRHARIKPFKGPYNGCGLRLIRHKTGD